MLKFENIIRLTNKKLKFTENQFLIFNDKKVIFDSLKNGIELGDLLDTNDQSEVLHVHTHSFNNSDPTLLDIFDWLSQSVFNNFVIVQIDKTKEKIVEASFWSKTDECYNRTIYETEEMWYNLVKPEGETLANLFGFAKTKFFSEEEIDEICKN
jgi:hypothetical protein